jgi:Fe-S-cluster containining protein
MPRRPSRRSTRKSSRQARAAPTRSTPPTGPQPLQVRQVVPTSQAIEILEELYAALPSLECRGKCAKSCTPIDMSDAERARIEQCHGIRIPPRHETAGPSCPALTSWGTCQVYTVRPMICRLWGVADSMRCPHGCRPANRWMPDQETMDLLLESFQVGGGPLANVTPRLRAMIAQPALRPAVGRLLRGDLSAHAEIVEWIADHQPTDGP